MDIKWTQRKMLLIASIACAYAVSEVSAQQCAVPHPDDPCECDSLSEVLLIANRGLDLEVRLEHCLPIGGSGTAFTRASTSQYVDYLLCGTPAPVGCGVYECEGPVQANANANGDAGNLLYQNVTSGHVSSTSNPICTFRITGDAHGDSVVTLGAIDLQTRANFARANHASSLDCDCIYSIERGLAGGAARAIALARFNFDPTQGHSCTPIISVEVFREAEITVQTECPPDPEDPEEPKDPKASLSSGIDFTGDDSFRFPEMERAASMMESEIALPNSDSNDDLIVNFSSIILRWTDSIGQSHEAIHHGVFADNASGDGTLVTRLGIFQNSAFDPSNWPLGESRTIEFEVPISTDDELTVEVIADSFSLFGDISNDGCLRVDDRAVVASLAAASTKLDTISYNARADFNLDGVIDVTDINALDAAVTDLCNQESYTEFCVEDCNGNRTLDICEIVSGTGADVDATGILDECEDCACPGDIETSGDVDDSDLEVISVCIENPYNQDYDCACADMDGDGLINGTDEVLLQARIICKQNSCDSGFIDCNSNNVNDDCEIKVKIASDTNSNEIPDECEQCTCPGDIKTSGDIDDGDLEAINVCIENPDNQDYDCACADMNGDGILDRTDEDLLEARIICRQNSCESDFTDCNSNNVDDHCEIDLKIVLDTNRDGIPDECE